MGESTLGLDTLLHRLLFAFPPFILQNSHHSSNKQKHASARPRSFGSVTVDTPSILFNM